MTLAHPYGSLLQNLFLTWPFYAIFVGVLALTGAWLLLLIAFIIASVAAAVHRKLVNKVSAAADARAAHTAHHHA